MFGNRGVIEAIGKNSVYIGALYRYKVAEKLIKAGFSLELTNNGLFEIAGFPKEVLAEFSKRRVEILEYMDKHGLSGSKSAEIAAHKTRAEKSDTPLNVLTKEWCQVVEKLGHDPLSLTDSIKLESNKLFTTGRFDEVKTKLFEKIFGRDKVQIELDKSIAYNAITYAAKSITENKEIFSDRELKAKAIEHLIGQNKIIDLKLLDSEILDLKDKKKFFVHKSEIDNEKKIATIESITRCTQAIEMIHQEKGKVPAISSAKDVINHLSEYNKTSKHTLTKSQYQAISKMLTSKDRVMAIQGFAGTGKTTMLKLSQTLAELKLSSELAVSQGYEFKGITIATSARNELIRKAHIDSDVYDAAINKIKCSRKDLSKTVFIVDESSMISTSQAHELITLIKEKNSRLIFVGDRAQLKSVNEGRFFEMAQTYGLQTAEMTDIVRQTNPRQLEVSIHASKGEIYDALNKLERVSELDSHEKRIEFFARSYLDMSDTQRNKTLLFAPKHNTIRKITAHIREGLQEQGILVGTKYKHQILNRVSLNNEDAKFCSYYRQGNIIKFNTEIKQFNINNGEHFVVEPITKTSLKTNTLNLKRENGKKIRVAMDLIPTQTRSGKQSMPLELYSVAELELQQNDKIVFNKSNNALGIANSDTGTVVQIDKDNMSIKLHDGNIKTLSRDSKEFKHLSHGYVLTNYKVQGKDKFSGLAFIESFDRFACNLSNFYVQITRAIHNMCLVTDNKNEVIKAIELNDDEKPSVLNFIDSKELKNIQKDSSNQNVNISNVIRISEEREVHTKKNVIDLVESYRAAKEQDGDSNELSSLAYKIVSSPDAYKYAQKILKYSFQSYRVDAIDEQVRIQRDKLNPQELSRLNTVVQYVESTKSVNNVIRSLIELKEEGNESLEVKNALYKNLYEAKLERDCCAKEITKDISNYTDGLKLFSIGQLNRLGIPQYKYSEEEQKAKLKLEGLLEQSSMYEKYESLNQYLSGNLNSKDKFAYELLSDKKTLSAHVYHFSEKLNITRKDIYWKLYTDSSKYEEKIFCDELTIKEQSCFKIVKDYKSACLETSQKWGEVFKFIKNKEDIPKNIQKDFTESSDKRNLLSSKITNDESFKKSLDFLKVNLEKKEKHELEGVKKEVVMGLSSLSIHSLKDKLHFAQSIKNDFKSYYPIMKSGNVNLKKIYKYVNYIAEKEYISSLDPSQIDNIKRLSKYKNTSIKAAKSWRIAFDLKESNELKIPEDALKSAISLSAKRDSIASLVNIDSLDHKALELFNVKIENLEKHRDTHNKKVNELYILKKQQKTLLKNIDKSGNNYSDNQTKEFVNEWELVLDCVNSKNDSLTSYEYANKIIPISGTSLSHKNKEIIKKYDLKFGGNTSENDEKNFKTYDLNKINSIFMSNPIDTYKSIFGEPKSITSKEMRYSGGLIVTLQGRNKGAWFDFSEGEGGWFLQAIEKTRGVSTKEAIKISAELCSLDPEINRKKTSIKNSKPNEYEIKKERIILENRIKSAKSIWDKSIKIEGTLGEKYLKEHRGIQDLSDINVRFMAPGTSYLNTNKEGLISTSTSKYPAVVFPGTSSRGTVKSVQRVFLDPTTGYKNGYMTNAKISKGAVSGNGIIVKQGDKKHPVFVAEGPETALSISNAFPKSTVVASMGLYNIKNIADLCKNKGNNFVIFAADNDGANNGKILIELKKAKENFKKMGMDSVRFEPRNQNIDRKTDWNDVLNSYGIDKIRDDFNRNIISKMTNNKVGINLINDLKIDFPEKISSISTGKIKSNIQKIDLNNGLDI